MVKAGRKLRLLYDDVRAGLGFEASSNFRNMYDRFLII
jgi:hypothetical protein